MGLINYNKKKSLCPKEHLNILPHLKLITQEKKENEEKQKRE